MAMFKRWRCGIEGVLLVRVKPTREVPVSIGERVRMGRKALHLSQEEVARRAGVSLNQVNRLERGEIVDPHFSTLAGLATALDMHISELVGEPTAPLTEVPSSAGPPVVHFAKLSDNAYEEVRENARTLKERVDLQRRMDFEYEQLSRWVRGLQEEEEEGAPSADIEEARELLKLARKRRVVAVYDVAENVIAFDEKRSPRLSRTAGKTVDEAYEEIQGIAKEGAESRAGERSREQPPL
jgi:transcriptional regulator with XRE-family HTH domain